MDNDNDALNTRVSSTQNVIHTLESQLSKARKTSRHHQETLSEKETENSKLKLLLEQSDKTHSDLRGKYEEKMVLLGELEEQNCNLQEHLGLFVIQILRYYQPILIY